jgi:hypothetical protein
MATASTQMAWGQAPTVPVTIKVTDPSGSLIPGASVRIDRGDRARGQYLTDARGRVAVDLPAGRYPLHVTAQGFAVVDKEIAVGSDPVNLTVEIWVAGGGPNISVTPYPTTAATPSVIAAAATADALTITAGPEQRAVLTLDALKDYPHQTVTILDHHTNASETYSGVPLMDLLAKLGVPHGEALHGKALTDYVVATGSDGYKSVVALAEIDPEFHPGMVLVADAMDGKPPGGAGPFRLIVSEDKRPARSVRNLVSIELKTAE